MSATLGTTISPRQKASPRIQSLIGLRGIAASIVVAHHAGNIAAEDRFFGVDAFGGVLTRFTGVGIFFVLSGFFIGWINWGAIGEKGKARDFFTRRLVRIYPYYWLVLVPLIILYQLFPGAGKESQRDLLNAVFSFFLLPYPDPPIYGVAWTLVHEFLFTVVFSLTIAVNDRSGRIFSAWAILIVVGNIAFHDLMFPVSFLLAPSNLQFLMGVAVARTLKHREVPRPGLILGLGMLVYLWFMIFGAALTRDPFWERAILGIGAAAMVAGLVGVESRGRFPVPRLLALLGAASFSVYLIHPITLSFLSQILRRLPTNELPVELSVVLLLIGGIAVGVVFHFIAEKPVTQAVSRLMERIRRKSPVAAPVT